MKFPCILILLLCAACTERTPPDDGLFDADSRAFPVGSRNAGGRSAEPESKHETRYATFSVEPGHITSCPGKDRIVSKVTWKLKEANVRGVKILLASDDDPDKKLFAMGGAIGSVDTGNWVGLGVRFYLVDESTGQELARHEVTMLPCEE